MTSVDELGLSIRAVNCLKRSGFYCAEEIPSGEEKWDRKYLKPPYLPKREKERIIQALERLRMLPRIKGYCKDCRFNEYPDRGIDIEAHCINLIMNKYSLSMEDYISLNGDDYCSCFELRKDKQND